MNDELAMDMELVDLGDAKEETKGTLETLIPESSPVAPYEQRT